MKNFHSPAVFIEKSCDRKLSPVVFVKYKNGARHMGKDKAPAPRAPYCSTTYVSINATCPESCQFKRVGCYVRSGFTGMRSKRLDDAAARGFTGDLVNKVEAAHIECSYEGGMIPQDGARGGRDMRLHVGGDVASTRGARILANVVDGYIRRGGGTVWTFTKRWRSIARKSFGRINVLASVMSTAEGRMALGRRYAPAVVVMKLPEDGKSWVQDGVRWIPCVYETSGRTCVECRLCLDRDLVKMNAGIAFGVHGRDKKRLRLQVLESQTHNVAGSIIHLAQTETP